MSKLIEKDLTTGSLSKGIFFYSLPLMFSNILQVLFNIADIAVAGRFAGPLALGAVGSTSQLLFLFTGILMGLGGGKKDRIIKSMVIANVYAFVIGAVESTLMYVFGHQCFALFTTDPAVIEAGMLRFSIMFFSLPVASFMDNTIAANRGLGKTFVPSIIVLAGSCLFRIAWIYTVFAYFQTIPSLFLLYIFSWTITAAAEIIYFFKQYKKI